MSLCCTVLWGGESGNCFVLDLYILKKIQRKKEKKYLQPAPCLYCKEEIGMVKGWGFLIFIHSFLQKGMACYLLFVVFFLCYVYTEPAHPLWTYLLILRQNSGMCIFANLHIPIFYYLDVFIIRVLILQCSFNIDYLKNLKQKILTESGAWHLDATFQNNTWRSTVSAAQQIQVLYLYLYIVCKKRLFAFNVIPHSVQSATVWHAELCRRHEENSQSFQYLSSMIILSN